MSELTLAARASLGAIRAYQALRAGRPSPCRFEPSCSVFGAEAVSTHGALRGVWLTVRRVARCNPWGGHGYDPVPSTQRARMFTKREAI